MGISVAVPAGALSPKEELGKKLFFDVGLSANSTQSCASCHAAEVGFTGPDSSTNATGGVYVLSPVVSETGTHRLPHIAATVHPCIVIRAVTGLAACSGTDVRPVPSLVIR